MRIVLAWAMSLTTALSFGQRADWVDPPSGWRDRIWFGGGIGLGFGSVTAIQLDPLVGYKIDKDGRASVGAGLSYWYYRDGRYVPALEFTGKGYRLLSRYRFIEQAFAHVEFLHLNVPRWSVAEYRYRDIWVPHLLVGGGYRLSVGGRGSVYFQALWEVMQDPNSVYRGMGPITTIGIGVGF